MKYTEFTPYQREHGHLWSKINHSFAGKSQCILQYTAWDARQYFWCTQWTIQPQTIQSHGAIKKKEKKKKQLCDLTWLSHPNTRLACMEYEGQSENVLQQVSSRNNTSPDGWRLIKSSARKWCQVQDTPTFSFSSSSATTFSVSSCFSLMRLDRSVDDMISSPSIC